MQAASPGILTLNAGSSSIRFALYDAGAVPRRTLHGKIDRIGLGGTRLSFEQVDPEAPRSGSLELAARESPVAFLLDWLATQSGFASVRAVGHRIVHGMHHSEPERITPELLDELKRIRPFDPDHLPREIDLIEAVRARHPQLLQIACFDTAFHRSMPRVARLLAIPRRYEALRVQRYGFHGLSYAYLMEELVRVGDPAARLDRRSPAATADRKFRRAPASSAHTRSFALQRRAVAAAAFADVHSLRVQNASARRSAADAWAMAPASAQCGPRSAHH
ncbi:hypothetical protein [Solimonas terrae]|uniref:hypothetical protein n=1 Tax=Solimonas terrae TaxID=1396819 RepID=UPI00344B017E